jgi:hypothetical protein
MMTTTACRTSQAKYTKLLDCKHSSLPFCLVLLSYCYCYSRYQDTRDRSDHLQLQMDSWETQMPELVIAYLDYHSWDAGDGMPTIKEDPSNVVPDGSGSIVGIELVDLFSKCYCFLRESYLNLISQTNGLACLTLRSHVPKRKSYLPWLPGFFANHYELSLPFVKPIVYAPSSPFRPNVKCCTIFIMYICCAVDVIIII